MLVIGNAWANRSISADLGASFYLMFLLPFFRCSIASLSSTETIDLMSNDQKKIRDMQNVCQNRISNVCGLQISLDKTEVSYELGEAT